PSPIPSNHYSKFLMNSLYLLNNEQFTLKEVGIYD
ncbi:MAG: hypothetical protein ACI9MD_000289, partial [Psychrobacter glaciei]